MKSRLQRSAADHSDLLAVLGLGLLLSVLFWPLWPLVPRSGLDESWRVGLIWAHDLGLRWGTDVVFTYGPLSFLDFPLANNRSSVLAASIAWVGYVLALTAGIHAVLGRSHSTLSANLRLGVTGVAAALLLVMPVASGLQNMHVLLPIGILATIAAAILRVPWLAGVVGLVLGSLLLHKLSDAALIGAIAAVCIPAALGFAGTLRLTAGASLAFVVSWIFAGQQLADIPAYVTAEVEVIRGFAAAMGILDLGYLWQFPVAIALGLVCLWIANRAARGLERVPRVGVVGGTALALWVAGRQAFTRHDSHFWYFFGVVLVFSVVFALVSANRSVLRAAALNGAVAFLVVVSGYATFLAPVDRQPSIVAAARSLGVISSRVRAERIFDDARLALAGEYGLTPELQSAVGSAPTMVDPWDISALFAMEGTWDPLPVMQQYAAYSPTLDEMNADSLTERPRQILRSLPYRAIDGRYPAWDGPRYQRIVYCSYEVTMATPKWQLLAPSAATRCGALDEAGRQVVVSANEQAAVPQRAGAITLVTIRPTRSIVESLIDFVAKPRTIYVSYGSGTWRLAQNPDAVELMLNAPRPHPSFADLPLAPHPTISLTHAARLEFSFVEVLPE